MPVTSPDQCRDHSADWTKYFYDRRGREIAAMIDAALIAEHEENPMQLLGHHSTTLHIVLNYFRNAPIIGKEFVYVDEPYERYKIGLVTGRGEPAAMLDETTYATEAEAIHAVFLARVNKLNDSIRQIDSDGGTER